MTLDVTQIRKDIPRTFCGDLEVGKYADVIERILVEYAAHDPDVGYCQGMTFVAAVVAVQFPDPPVASSHFGALMRGIRGLWLPQFPLLLVGAVAFEALYRTHLPNLHHHFAARHMSSDMFLADAWLALFSRWCPFAQLWRVFELIETEGFAGVLSLTAALLEAHAAALVEADDFASLFVLLKALGKLPQQPDEQELLAAARRLLPLARDSIEAVDDVAGDLASKELHSVVSKELSRSEMSRSTSTIRREGSAVVHEASGLELIHEDTLPGWLGVARDIASRLPRVPSSVHSEMLGGLSGPIGQTAAETISAASVAPKEQLRRTLCCCRRQMLGDVRSDPPRRGDDGSAAEDETKF